MLREKIAKKASKAGLLVAPGSLEGLEAYFDLLRRWNRKVSLTSLPVDHAGDEAIDRLLVEPMLAARYLLSQSARVLDIGSGGGSPAIPLKLMEPGISLRMVESKTRKAAFLREVVRALNLKNTDVEAVRSEELLVRPDLHEAADVVSLRAVKVTSKTLASLQSFLKPHGRLFLFGTGSGLPSETATPQLVRKASHVLLKQWGSQLDILEKRSS